MLILLTSVANLKLNLTTKLPPFYTQLSMKIVLLGSRGNVANPLSKLLVSKGADVRVITR